MNPMNAHTPGLWRHWQATTNKRLRLNKWCVSNGDSSPVADCGNRRDSEANAQLIASAPTLLAQRNELKEALETIVRNLTASGPADYKRDCFAALQTARLALANVKD